MNQGSSDRIPVSSLILFASIVFTLTTYLTFKALWEVAIPVWLFIVVLGLQFATLLLGSSKVLTQLGAASLSALIAVGACIGAVILIFPPVLELQIAGAVGGGTALVFIMASFVAASRVDPVPYRAPEPLNLGNLEEDHTAELVKYGEVRAPDATGTNDLPLTDTSWDENVENVGSSINGDELLPMDEKDLHAFNELFESTMGTAPGGQDSVSTPEILDSEEDRVSVEVNDAISPEFMLESPSRPDPSEEVTISNGWVDETAKVMAHDVSRDTIGDMAGTKARSEEDFEKKPVTTETVPGFKMRTRYKVLDEASGEHYGTYFGDEGYSTLDPVSLTALLSPKLANGDLRIVKLDWSNFDEVEVHIKVDEVVAMKLDVDVKDDIDEARILSGEESQLEVEAVSGSEAAPPVDEPAAESEKEEAEPAVNPSGPRYMIYDRRTIQPMGEYVPEGDRSRIDRLALYKMFPEYDFKTFEIDSIRWEADEVRILIRGEKKQT